MSNLRISNNRNIETSGLSPHSPFFLSVLQEKEIYRWPIRESLKSMLAMGWSIDRTKDGESMSQQRENEKMRKISQTSQVQCEQYVTNTNTNITLSYRNWS